MITSFTTNDMGAMALTFCLKVSYGSFNSCFDSGGAANGKEYSV
jgi:hypothetical protein